MGKSVNEILENLKKSAAVATPEPGGVATSLPTTSPGLTVPDPRHATPTHQVIITAPAPKAPEVAQVNVEGLSEEELTILSRMNSSALSLPQSSSVAFITNSKLDGFVRDGYAPSRELTGVILDFAFDYTYYDRPFDPNQITSPACFALGRDVETLSPDDNSPVRQTDGSCKLCPNNEFGSALNGSGKACRNSLRVLFKDLSDGSVWKVRFSPTSLSRALKTISGIARRGPLSLVMVTLKSEMSGEYQTIGMTAGEPVLIPETIHSILTDIKNYSDEVLVPYDVTRYAPPAQRKGQKPARF